MEAPTIIQALVVGNVDGEKGVLNKEVLKGVKDVGEEREAENLLVKNKELDDRLEKKTLETIVRYFYYV